MAGSGYWTAAAHEYLGYLYRDMAASGNYAENADYFLALAKEHFEKAAAGFRKSVRQSDGSPSAVAALADGISESGSIITPRAGRAQTGGMPLVSGGKIINLDNGKIKIIPDNLPAETESFSAARNRITEFPAGLSRCPKLRYVNLKNNAVKTIGNNAEVLRNLTYLNLSGNRIKTIPAGLAALKKLEFLDLSDNKLKEIPAFVTSLKNLKILDISGNNIEFSQIATLIKNLPGTNILFDRYEQVDEQEEEFDE